MAETHKIFIIHISMSNRHVKQHAFNILQTLQLLTQMHIFMSIRVL